MKQEEIRKQAKMIMDEFIEALDKAGNNGGEVGFEDGSGARKPRGKAKDEGFRERFLGNAPRVKDGCIVAEKKKW